MWHPHYLRLWLVLIITRSLPKCGLAHGRVSSFWKCRRLAVGPIQLVASGGKVRCRTAVSSCSRSTAALVGMGLVVASVVADELFGVITKVDADAKKITVVEKDTDKEIEVKITDETEYVAGKGAGKVDFEKLEKGIERAKEKGRKGISVKITHEKAVASKIVVERRKKKAE